MTRDAEQLRIASERTISASRELRAESELIRRWSHQLLVDAQRYIIFFAPAHESTGGRHADAHIHSPH